jgi:PPOX class probable F420-dependent enzyme
MSEMTTAEYVRFLTEGTRTAKLATVRRDGRPHVVPVWFVLDGDDLLFTTARRSVKGRAIRHDPRVAACIDDDRPPFAFVMIEGRATVIEDPHAVLITATRIARRYMGLDKAEEYARLNSGDWMMAVRITPENIASEDNVTDISGVSAGEA